MAPQSLSGGATHRHPLCISACRPEIVLVSGFASRIKSDDDPQKSWRGFTHVDNPPLAERRVWRMLEERQSPEEPLPGCES
jgi:hypothetical protein